MKYIIFWFLIIIILAVFVILKFSKNKKLDNSKIEFYQKKLRQVSLDNDKKHQIIDFDKFYHKILLDIWYDWTFWDILKLKPREINNLNKIWELHKLRNKLVHDFDLLEEVILMRKSKEYEKELKNLLKKVS